MNRKNFMKKCAAGCLTFAGFQMLLESCVAARFSSINAEVVGENLVIPASSFEIERNGKVTYKPGLIVRNEILQYPVCIFRNSENDFQAYLMRCTHQGTELQLFGDRFQCSAHGSEFASTGAVIRGPAESALRSFPVTLEKGEIKINLK